MPSHYKRREAEREIHATYFGGGAPLTLAPPCCATCLASAHCKPATVAQESRTAFGQIGFSSPGSAEFGSYFASGGMLKMKAPASVTRLYTRTEHALDAVVHVAGILFAINASLWLLWHVTGLPVVISVSVYCAGLLAMIGASAAYNLTPQHRPSKQVLRRLDHSAIFIMIAATYTPFAANRLGHPERDIILAAIWVCATAGVALKVLLPRRFELSSLGLYLGMGWMVVTVIKPLATSVATIDFWLLIAGGFVYSVGVVFYLVDRIPFHKAIWHAFVLIAAILHFSAIAMEFAA